MTDEDAPTPPPDPQPTEQVTPLRVDIAVVVPEGIATFGLLEHIMLPPDILDAMRTGSPDFLDLVHAGLQKQFDRVSANLATTLHAVLVQRSSPAAPDEPVTHEAYVARQQELANGRADAQKLARAAAEEAANRG